MTAVSPIAAEPLQRLLAFAFRERPLFRASRFDRHVKQWDKHMRRQVWVRFHNDPAFAAAYQERVERALVEGAVR